MPHVPRFRRISIWLRFWVLLLILVVALWALSYGWLWSVGYGGPWTFFGIFHSKGVVGATWGSSVGPGWGVVSIPQPVDTLTTHEDDVLGFGNHSVELLNGVVREVHVPYWAIVAILALIILPLWTRQRSLGQRTHVEQSHDQSE